MSMQNVSPPNSIMRLLGKGEGTVAEALGAQSARRPEQTFLLWGDRRWTYGEGVQEVARVAAVLHEYGVPHRCKRVVSFLANQPAALWSWLGTSWAGGEYVALNHQHRGEILADMLCRARADVLVTDSQSVSLLPDLAKAGIKVVLIVDQEVVNLDAGIVVVDFHQAAAPSERSPAAGPGDLACVLYTSGTTGPSKAVMVPHNQIVRGAARIVDSFGLNGDDVLHHWLPLYHLGGQLHMTMSAVISGATIALFPTFSKSQFWAQVHRCRATVMCGFSAIVSMLLSQAQDPLEIDNPLRVGIIAGIPADLHGRFEERFAVKLGENYGGSEADPLTVGGIFTPLKPGSLGTAAPDFELAIHDEHDNPVEPGKPGEIVARPLAPHVMFLGYEDDPDTTLRVFRNLWYHTGDMGLCDREGNFFFCGRLKHAIRRRGENISAYELEQIVMSHDKVEACAAIGVPSPLGEQEVKIVVTLLTGANLTASSLHDFCRERMAKFMVPRFIEFVSELPFTKLGKLDREALARVGPGLWDAQGVENERA